jgi:Flp pilus assembly protein TadD
MRLAAALFVLLTMPAFAAAPPAKLSPLDKLFAELSKTASPDEAKPIEEQIMVLFEQSGSATVDILMKRSTITLAAGDKDTTKKLVYAITTVAPDFAEGWRRRAMLEIAANDDADAIVSLQKVVTLNPREFQAQSELGKLLEAYGDKKSALDAYRKALAIDPHVGGIDKHTQELARQVEGEKI